MRQTAKALRNTLALMLVALLYQQTCLAQVDPWERVKHIPAQQKITLHLHDGRQLKGRFVEADTASATLLANGKTVRIGKDEIRRISRRSRGLGALIGMGIGAGGGIAIGANHCLVCDSGASRSGNAAGVGILLGGLGAAAGGIIGAGRTIYKEPASATTPGR
jgi:hypothetical protein